MKSKKHIPFPYWNGRVGTEEQQKLWDAQVKAQQDWNAKPRAEQIADARYVHEWDPESADAVLRGTMWMTDALANAKIIEAICCQSEEAMDDAEAE